MDQSSLVYAGFWARLGASIIDSILLVTVTLPILMAFYGESYLDSENIVEGPMDFMISWVLPMVSTIAFWVVKQSTPGKMALKMRIVDARTGQAPGVGQCIGRYLAYILSALPLLLGFLWVAFDSRKQGWHDKLAGTVVIRHRPKDIQVSFPDAQ